MIFPDYRKCMLGIKGNKYLETNIYTKIRLLACDMHIVLGISPVK